MENPIFTQKPFLFAIGELVWAAVTSPLIQTAYQVTSIDRSTTNINNVSAVQMAYNEKTKSWQIAKGSETRFYREDYFIKAPAHALKK
jgi:hypothetical protein